MWKQGRAVADTLFRRNLLTTAQLAGDKAGASGMGWKLHLRLGVMSRTAPRAGERWPDLRTVSKVEVGGLDWWGARSRQGRIQSDSRLLALAAGDRMAPLMEDGKRIRGGGAGELSSELLCPGQGVGEGGGEPSLQWGRERSQRWLLRARGGSESPAEWKAGVDGRCGKLQAAHGTK